MELGWTGLTVLQKSIHMYTKKVILKKQRKTKNTNWKENETKQKTQMTVPNEM